MGKNHTTVRDENGSVWMQDGEKKALPRVWEIITARRNSSRKRSHLLSGHCSDANRDDPWRQSPDGAEVGKSTEQGRKNEKGSVRLESQEYSFIRESIRFEAL